MARPNDFEKALLNAATAAQKFHIDMTEGAYLGYSHESFLQNFIAMKMFEKTGHCVYVDPSPKKIRESAASASKKPPKNLQQRFDLVFWLKTDEEVKAIVEIKRAWGKKPVMDDIYKLWEYRKTKDGRNIRYYYVLYYTDHSRKDRNKGEDSKYIQRRFRVVDKEIKEGTGRDKQNVGLRHGPADYICDPDKDDPWGFALFRC